jgi:DNA-binding XRE family transcriptional regulator
MIKSHHKTKANRRLITNSELAQYLGVHRHTIKNKIKEYQGNYDPKDILSVLDFVRYLISK